ncbi:recombinase family protein [Dyella sp. ASV21]|uniref:recombinase family protein n=1 Tax=Dyella sp. ASV21 TaxID=2795114 RepID=UPI0018EC1A17|nr:recombinase family protein [Dyella sp. ASV21]
MKFVAYLRVSTSHQGQSGLGLEAQRAAIAALIEQRQGVLLESFCEVESGSLNSRPELAQALHLAKLTGATLVIAKLDRLSRNAAFLLALQESGARFIAADMPDANELTVGIMALVAQQERQAISRRTREALAAARARGQRLGNPNGAAALRRADRGNSAAVAAVKSIAADNSESLRPLIDQLRSDGVGTLAGIASELNRRGILTPRQKTWHRSSVSNLLKRLAAA